MEPPSNGHGQSLVRPRKYVKARLFLYVAQACLRSINAVYAPTYEKRAHWTMAKQKLGDAQGNGPAV